MGRVSTGKYAVFLAFLIVLLGGAGLAKGGLYITRHEGDVAHMVEIILRMLNGQTPHLDFSTPIGFLAFLPVALLAKAGLGIGQAFIAAQIGIAIVLAPMILRVARSRLTGLTAWAFGAVMMALIMGLVHGENITALSVSMYYNRWAWVCAAIAIFLAVLPPLGESDAPRLDGAITGLMLAALALIKPTYFVAFVIPVAVGFLSRGAGRSLVAGIATGIGVALVTVLTMGVDFFPAYIADLLSVTQSETRAAPGAGFLEVLNGPRFLIGSLTLILSVIVLRQAGLARAGLLLLLLAPGFVYVTYQNFGNDPKWLILLAFYLMALRPARGHRVLFNTDARNATAALALVAFALIAPSLQNVVTSPFRHYATDTDGFAPQFATRPEVDDIYVKTHRTGMVLVRTAMVETHPELAPYVIEDEMFEPVTFLGETLPLCSLQAGDSALHAYMADRLKEPPFNYPPEAQFFVTDIASGIWILGGFAPLKGGAPWYYSGTPGIENADAIIVPTCPLDVEVERNALKAVEQAGLTLRPPLRDPMMLVYPIVRE